MTDDAPTHVRLNISKSFGRFLWSTCRKFKLYIANRMVTRPITSRNVTDVTALHYRALISRNLSEVERRFEYNTYMKKCKKLNGVMRRGFVMADWQSIRFINCLLYSPYGRYIRDQTQTRRCEIKSTSAV